MASRRACVETLARLLAGCMWLAIGFGIAGAAPPGSLAGRWREVGQLECHTGAILEPEAGIEDLELREDGAFVLTWAPFEQYHDYWGTYAFDAEGGQFRFRITLGNNELQDLDCEGGFAVPTAGVLIFESIWLGSLKGELEQRTETLRCGHVFLSYGHHGREMHWLHLQSLSESYRSFGAPWVEEPGAELLRWMVPQGYWEASIPLEPTQRDSEVEDGAQNLLANGTFEEGVTGWSPHSWPNGIHAELQFSVHDDERPSVAAVSNASRRGEHATVTGARACVPAAEAFARYRFGGDVKVPAAQQGQGSASISIHWCQDDACEEGWLGEAETEWVQERGIWVSTEATAMAPRKTRSALVELTVVKEAGKTTGSSDDLFTALFDSVYLKQVGPPSACYGEQE